MAKRPTIADLARDAGVSVATVDRVLNGRLPVREETARRVYEAANAIGYHAAGLIRQRLQQDLPQYRWASSCSARTGISIRRLPGSSSCGRTRRPSFRGTPLVDFPPIAGAVRDRGEAAETRRALRRRSPWCGRPSDASRPQWRSCRSRACRSSRCSPTSPRACARAMSGSTTARPGAPPPGSSPGRREAAGQGGGVRRQPSLSRP